MPGRLAERGSLGSAAGPRSTRMSIMSRDALESIDDIEQEVQAMSRSVDEAAQQQAERSFAELPPGLRNRLAQLHGDANRLMANKLDAILCAYALCSYAPMLICPMLGEQA